MACKHHLLLLNHWVSTRIQSSTYYLTKNLSAGWFNHYEFPSALVPLTGSLFACARYLSAILTTCAEGIYSPLYLLHAEMTCDIMALRELRLPSPKKLAHFATRSAIEDPRLQHLVLRKQMLPFPLGQLRIGRRASFTSSLRSTISYSGNV